jgi:predicted AAA+ superfamily ATPase
MIQARYLAEYIKRDLKKKMVFLGGPRQVGKTTLSLQLLESKNEAHPGYLNWDVPRHRQAILKEQLPSNQKLIVLDEVHKYRQWRTLLKGLYDSSKSTHSFLITGSARLDVLRRGGDSLQGRFYSYRLHPLSLFEIDKNCSASSLKQLLKFGGFPEPFFTQDETEWKRWQNLRKTRVLQEDILSIEAIRQVSELDLLMDILPSRVGSSLSIKNLRQDLSVAHETIERYVQILENLYYCYRIPPYGPPRIKAVKKEQKCYMWDWSLCENKGALVENFLASQLLKYCHFHEDVFGEKMELRFLRDHDGHEIDFIVLKNKQPLFGVECKSGDTQISSHIKYYAERTKIPQFFQTHLGNKDYVHPGQRTRVLPLHRFCRDILKI